MKIALSGAYNTMDRGPSRTHQGLAHGLAKLGHNVLMLTHGDRETHAHDNVEVRCLQERLHSVQGHFDFHERSTDIARDECDVYHTLEEHAQSADVKTVQWTTTLPAALRYYRHNINVREELGDLILNYYSRRGAKRAGHVVATSPVTKHQMERYWRLTPDEIVPLGVRAEMIDEAGPVSDPPRILIPGRIQRKKGQHRVLDGLDPKSEDYTVDIVGSIENEDYADEALEGWRDDYHGFVSQECLDELYRMADIVAIPSYHENFGLTAVEAIARGCATVVMDSCGFGQLSSVKGDSGVAVVTDGDHAVQTVEALSSSPNLRAQKEAAVETARKLTWERIAERYEQLYTETQNSHSSLSRRLTS